MALANGRRLPVEEPSPAPPPALPHPADASVVVEVTPVASRSMLDAIEGGRHVPIQCGHGDAAHVPARSDSPRCRFMPSIAVGLVAQVALLDTDAGRRPDSCSIAPRALKFVEERCGGRVIRFVTDAVLDSIAVVERGAMEPCYPLARAVRSTKGYARTTGLDAMTDFIGKIRKSTPWLLVR